MEDWIYEYGLLDELAINAYWTARYAECVNACDRLLGEGKLPAGKRDQVLGNKNFAIGKLKEIAAMASPEAGSFLGLLAAARRKEAAGSLDDEVIAAYVEAAAAGRPRRGPTWRRALLPEQEVARAGVPLCGAGFGDRLSARRPGR